jgi:hypothetical protein
VKINWIDVSLIEIAVAAILAGFAAEAGVRIVEVLVTVAAAALVTAILAESKNNSKG